MSRWAKGTVAGVPAWLAGLGLGAVVEQSGVGTYLFYVFLPAGHKATLVTEIAELDSFTFEGYFGSSFPLTMSSLVSLITPS